MLKLFASEPSQSGMDTEALLSELDVSCLAAEPIAAEPVAAEMARANEEEEQSVSGESHENVKRALKRLHTII